MNAITNLLREFRKDRISRILDEGSPQLLNQPLIKKALAFAAVVASWVTFITLLVAADPRVSDDFKTLAKFRVIAALAMILSFLLLRVSMRRITSLPEEFLDEREIRNRDWAFKTGYMVIRRVGLGLCMALIGFLVVSHFLQVSPATNWDEMWLYKLNLSVTTYVTLLISSTGPIMYFAWLSFLLAYVAYSFPLILLGWREAQENIVVEGLRPDQSELHSIATRYFRKLWRVTIFALIALASVFTFDLFTYGFMWVIFAWVGYSTYVFFWASITLVKVALKLKEPGFGGALQLPKRSILVAYLGSSISGIAILVSLIVRIGSEAGITAAFELGVVSVLLHIYGFASVRRAAYIIADSTRG